MKKSSKLKTVKALGTYNVVLDEGTYILESGFEYNFPEKVAKQLIDIKLCEEVKNGKL